jgi:CheY-like chemotaxis protein
MKKFKTFFIADDDPDDVDFFIEAVNKVDGSIQCYSAGDGEEALQKLKKTLQELPDLIFLDLNMPRINGKQCLIEIKRTEKLSDIPVIIYTTSSLQKDEEETKKLGASYFLTKPSNFKDLCKELDDILAGKRT